MKLDIVNNILQVQPIDEKELSLLNKIKDLIPFDENWTVSADCLFQFRYLTKSIKKWERTDSFKNYIKNLKPNTIIEIRCGVINSHIDFKGLDLQLPIYSEIKEQIDKTCSYFLFAAVNSDRYKKGLWDGMIHLYEKRYDSFPTGLLYLIKEILNRYKIRYVVYNTYDDSPEREFDWVANDNIVPTEDQVTAINSAIKFKRGVIKSPTGFGKTAVVSVGIVAKFAVPTLFIANKKTLLDDAKSAFTGLIDGLDESKVHQIKNGIFGDIKIKKDTQKSDISDLDSHIIVATIQSLHSRLNDPRTASQLKKWLSKVCKLVIIDECQAINDRQWKEVLKECKAPYRIALSATPKRTDGASLLINSMTGDRIFMTTANEQISKDRLCELDIKYYTFDHKLYNEDDKDIVYSEAYSEWIVHNDERNKFLVKKVKELVDEGRLTLLLINIIEHGHVLMEELKKVGLDESDVRFVYGETKDKIRQKAISEFRKGMFKVLIGSTIFDAGVDIPAISGVVIAGAGNSEITLIQKIGRGARNVDFEEVLGYLPEFMKNQQKKVTKVIDLYDANVKFFAKQAKNRFINASEEFGKNRVEIVGSASNYEKKKSSPKMSYDEAIDSEIALVNSFSTDLKQTKGKKKEVNMTKTQKLLLEMFKE